MSIRSFAVAAILCVAVLGATWWTIHAFLGSESAATADPGAPQAAALGTFRTVAPPRPLPALAVTAMDGAPAEVAAAGGLTVLNLWATWCAPCVKELPSLDRLQAAMAAEGVRVVALSVDRGGAAQVQPFLDRLEVRNLTVLLDPKADSMKALEVRGLPTTLLLDGDGREIARMEGGLEWDTPAMMADLRARKAGG